VKRIASYIFASIQSGWTNWAPGGAAFAWGPNILLFVLLFLLGWHDFGFVIH